MLHAKKVVSHATLKSCETGPGDNAMLLYHVTHGIRALLYSRKILRGSVFMDG